MPTVGATGVTWWLVAVVAAAVVAHVVVAAPPLGAMYSKGPMSPLPASVTPSTFIFCTLATKATMAELRVFLHSLRHYHARAPVYITCTPKLAHLVQTLYLPRYPNHDVRLDVSVEPALEAPPMDRVDPAGAHLALMLKKIRALDVALASRSRAQVDAGVGVWFMDCDVTLMSPIPVDDVPPLWADVGLSPHGHTPGMDQTYGWYNGGYVFTRSVAFGAWWEATTHVEVAKEGSYYEQKVLELAASQGGFRVYELPFTHNFGWWRLLSPPPPITTKQRMELFTVSSEDGRVLYDGAPLVSVHTHWVFDHRPQWAQSSSSRYMAFLTRVAPEDHPLHLWLHHLHEDDVFDG